MRPCISFFLLLHCLRSKEQIKASKIIIITALLLPVFLQAQSNDLVARGFTYTTPKIIFDRPAEPVIKRVRPYFYLSVADGCYLSRVFAPVDTSQINKVIPTQTGGIDGIGIMPDRMTFGIIDPATTINDLTGPLIFVNNFPYDRSIDSITPDYVQSITILKDSAATAVYGVRGLNGVILITLKPHYWVNEREHIIYRKKKRTQ